MDKYIIKNIDLSLKEEYNRLANHPLQSFEWGLFRKQTGIEVIRLGKFINDNLAEIAQITLHPLFSTRFCIGYFPKGGSPSAEMLDHIIKIGKKIGCVFVKLEPDITVNSKEAEDFNILRKRFSLRKSPHPLFPKYTFRLDLTPSIEELQKKFHHKTRYNIKIAKKHLVSVNEDNSPGSFREYLDLLTQTTKRQGFFAHDKEYHRLMWQTLQPAGIAHLFKADYENAGQKHCLAAWILFLFNKVLYYPYGASSVKFRNVMASNLLMWEAILFGKNNGAKYFDMWGSLGENPDINDPWYGFHKFKQGYAPQLTEFIGSYDLVIDPLMYSLYNSAYILRQGMLKLLRKIK